MRSLPSALPGKLSSLKILGSGLAEYYRRTAQLPPRFNGNDLLLVLVNLGFLLTSDPIQYPTIIMS